MCGICRAPFDGNPPEAAFPGDDAPVVWGMCGHAFHIQCINKWLSSQPEQRCPFCRRAWEFKQAEAAVEVPPSEEPVGGPLYPPVPENLLVDLGPEFFAEGGGGGRDPLS